MACDCQWIAKSTHAHAQLEQEMHHKEAASCTDQVAKRNQVTAGLDQPSFTASSASLQGLKQKHCCTVWHCLPSVDGRATPAKVGKNPTVRSAKWGGEVSGVHLPFSNSSITICREAGKA